MLKKQLLLIISTLLMGYTTFSQIVVTNTQTPSELIQNVLLGNGVVATNITYNGSAVNAGTVQSNVTYYDATSTTFPIANGVLMTSGAGTAAAGPNDSDSDTDATGTSVVTDADLQAIAPNTITNGVILEFDFVATGDSVSFQYLFGSEEYPNNYGGSFYDVFGFFLSGPGFAGPYSNGAVNIATIPGTATPMSILNLNPGTNVAYYVDNVGGAAYGTAIQYDGTSIVLTSGAALECGETYHIKLAISNVGDQAYDSGVFLKGGSFSADAVNVQAQTSAGIPLDSVMLAEGCSSIDILFIRPVSFTDSAQVFYINSIGDLDTALDVSSYIDSVYFPIGVDSVTFTVNPVDDGITEPMELLQIMVFSITACGDTLYDSVRIYVVDPVSVDFTTTPSTCVPDGSATALAVGNIGTPNYAWTGPGPDNTDTVYTALYDNIISGWYYMTLSDDQCTIYDSVFVDATNLPDANISPLTYSGSAPSTFTFSNTSQNATSYLWDFDGVSPQVSVNDLSSQTVTFPLSGSYTVTLWAYLGVCVDSTTVPVNVLDLPVASAPNVFTPNGDGKNDFFAITTQNVTNVALTITNRWGNVVYEESTALPFWNGYTDGKLHSAGVYFYTYVATGVNGDEIKGQGFVELILE